MIQLSQTDVLIDQDAIPKLAAEFAATGCVRLPGFLTPPILKPLLGWLETAQFVVRDEFEHSGQVVGTTLFVPGTERSLFLLHFILNRPALFRVVERISDCPRVANFTGRLHRTIAEPDHQIDWHNDAVDGRTLGIGINLSAEPYSGGTFQIRNPNREVCAEVGRAAPGDAYLFSIGRGWQHRLTPVDSGQRTVGVGWFRTGRDWREYALSGLVSRAILTRDEVEGRETPTRGGEGTADHNCPVPAV
jgi:hypothetical protein